MRAMEKLALTLPSAADIQQSELQANYLKRDLSFGLLPCRQSKKAESGGK